MFAYRRMPFGLENVRSTFQWAMLFSFHELRHIFESYLDDLASQSCKRSDHPSHLWLIFEWCHYYQIHLNFKKCSFWVTSGHILGFTVLKTWIMVDPLKVEAIVELPPLCTISQLQILQMKENFIQPFVMNYTDITKGFMCVLKKGGPLCWDEATQ